MENNCSILILSCDKNKELLKVFFETFDFYWKDCAYEIFISMEKCNNIDVTRKVHILNYDKSKYWSARIIDALENIDTENVLILLDDFIIEDTVKDAEIASLNSILTNDKRIANILMSEIGEKNIPTEMILSKYVQREKYGRYKTALQCGLWKRKVLKGLLKYTENAWEFEIFSNLRAFSLNMTLWATLWVPMLRSFIWG